MNQKNLNTYAIIMIAFCCLSEIETVLSTNTKSDVEIPTHSFTRNVS